MTYKPNALIIIGDIGKVNVQRLSNLDDHIRKHADVLFESKKCTKDTKAVFDDSGVRFSNFDKFEDIPFGFHSGRT